MKSVNGKKYCWKCKTWKPTSEFNKNKSKPDGFSTECRKCASAYHRQWSKNGGHAHMREHARKKWADGSRRDYWYRKTYGITLEDFERLEKQQGGKCAVCGYQPKRLCVDHCHETGKVRGLLCHKCNLALARFGDNLETIVQTITAYLKGDVHNGTERKSTI